MLAVNSETQTNKPASQTTHIHLQASRDPGSRHVRAPPPHPGPPCPQPQGGAYPVALCRVVLCAVGDLGLAVVQDAPDDGNAGHLLPGTDQVLRLLKGHYPVGCKGPGRVRGSKPQSPLYSPIHRHRTAQMPGGCLSPRTPPLSGEGRGKGWATFPEKVEGAGTVSNRHPGGAGAEKGGRVEAQPRGGPESKEQGGGQLGCP